MGIILGLLRQVLTTAPGPLVTAIPANLQEASRYKATPSLNRSLVQTKMIATHTSSRGRGENVKAASRLWPPKTQSSSQ